MILLRNAKSGYSFPKGEEEKRNGNKAVLALKEIDLLLEQFQKEQKAQEMAYRTVVQTAKTLHDKYVDYQRGIHKHSLLLGNIFKNRL